ncbi:DUF5947 family protein [Glaciimonas sp. PCH181]|uniref:DUF5947 family protein n=1 Tax=Glaciimonas sp. PCH181 TaxID=2133943 RepID=UPI000D38EE31|nr:DUF5947 family protein [Glaciimonas sp. PCH181]PUA18917.1 hypothetical protein C7W93_03115 [Glaciimonas sp. PCH181]
MSPVRSEGWIAGLRRFTHGAEPEQRCEMCSAVIRADHRHLMQISERRLLCCCHACAVLFGNGAENNYRLIPTRSQQLTDADFVLTDAQWDTLQIPIDIAFFFKSTPLSRVVALYPGPAGTTESSLDLSAWEELQAESPVLAALAPDVEALLINRAHGARDYYRVPIDQCYALTGIIRTHWHGLTGGTEAWAAIHRFFVGLHANAAAPERSFHA